MEHEHRLTPTSRLFEARNELREHIDLETCLIERINQLPEDDYCHNARDALALGAGYAYLSRDDTKPVGDEVFVTFFSLQPRNKYLDEITVRRTQQALVRATLEHTTDGVDPYVLEELNAFLEGYSVTRNYLINRNIQQHLKNSELA